MMPNLYYHVTLVRTLTLDVAILAASEEDARVIGNDEAGEIANRDYADADSEAHVNGEIDGKQVEKEHLQIVQQTCSSCQLTWPLTKRWCTCGKRLH